MLMPGHSIPVLDSQTGKWIEATVIASKVYNDDEQVIQSLLLLLPTARYYQCMIFDPAQGTAEAQVGARHENIVQAVEEFENSY